MLTLMMMGAALAADQDIPLALDLAPDTATVAVVDSLVGFGSGSFIAGQPRRGALDLTLQLGWVAAAGLSWGTMIDRSVRAANDGRPVPTVGMRLELAAISTSFILLRSMDIARSVRSAEMTKRERWDEAYGVDGYRVPSGPSRAEQEQQAAKVVLLVLEDKVPEGSEPWFALIVAVGQAINQGHDGVSIRDAALRGRELQPGCLPADCVRAGLPE